MIKKILVSGIPIAPSENSFQIHYSVYKTFGTASGFAKLGHDVYVLSKKSTEKIDGVKLIPYNQISKEFLSSLDYFIFTQELGVEKVLNCCENIHWLEEQKINGLKKPLFIMKMGKHDWIKKSRWGDKGSLKMFDLFFSQEEGFSQQFKKEYPNFKNKIHFSEMGVPDTLPSKSKKSPFEKAKHNIVYIGRLRQSPSKLPFLRDLMEELGSDYKLIILPGSFSKPNELLTEKEKSHNKFGSETAENFGWLQKYFSAVKNIDLHFPVPWGKHWDYLYHADVGLDFSPNPKIKKHSAGNAKLLEYLTAGLPSITEAGAGNSELITQSSGGIIVPNNSDIKVYASKIKEMTSKTYNRDNISKITIANNNWELRAKEMLKIISE